MTRIDRYRLEDIVEHARKIASKIALGREHFDSDDEVFDLVKWWLVIIGEAANRVTDDVRSALPDVDWVELTRRRNLLVHLYHRVDRAEVWLVCSDVLPRTAGRIIQALSDMPDDLA